MHLEFAYFYSVVLIDLELKRSDAFILSRSSLENHTRFQTKMHGKSLYPFSDQKRLKIHTLWGGTYPYDLYNGIPPPPRASQKATNKVQSKPALQTAGPSCSNGG